MTCILDVASSVALLDDNRLEDDLSNVPQNCMKIVKKGENRQFLFDVMGNDHNLEKNDVRDMIFNLKVLQRERDRGLSKEESIKSVIGDSWREEVTSGKEASSKRKSILQKFDLFSRVVSGRYDYGVSVFSVQDDITNIQNRLKARILEIFEICDFATIYDDLVHRTEKIRGLNSQTKSLMGGGGVQNAEQTNGEEKDGSLPTAFFSPQAKISPPDKEINTLAFDILQNTKNVQEEDDAQDSATKRRRNKKESKNTKLSSDSSKKETSLPPLILPDDTSQVIVAQPLERPKLSDLKPETRLNISDVLGFKVLHDVDNDDDIVASLNKCFDEDFRVRNYSERLLKMSRLSALMSSNYEVSSIDLKLMLHCEMLKHSSSPMLWAQTLREVIDHWNRLSSGTQLVNHIEFWRAVSEIVSLRTGRSINIFNSSAQGYRDVMGRIKIDGACVSDTNSIRCIEFITATLRRIELRCPPSTWPIVTNKKGASKDAIVELAHEVVLELVNDPIPFGEEITETAVMAKMGDIVCQEWRKLVVPPKKRSSGSIVDKILGNVMGSSDDEAKSDGTGANNKVYMNPFADIPYFAECADALKLDMDMDYVKDGVLIIKSFAEREVNFASECLKELSNETRRVYRDSSFNPIEEDIQQKGGAAVDDEGDDRGMRRARMVQYFYMRMKIVSEKYFKFHGTFWKRYVKSYSTYVKRFAHSFQLSIEEASVIKDFNDAIMDLTQRGQAFYMTAMSRASELRYDLGDVDEDSDALVAMKRTECMTRIEDLSENMALMYKNEMGFAFDAQFGILAALKLVQLGVTAFSLSMAVKLFEDTYLVQVYTQNKPPPSIYVMIGYFLGFSVAINAVLFFVLWILSYVKNLPSEPSLFDGHLLLAAFVDYAAFLVTIVIVALIVGAVIMEKKYFRYDLEGPRAIRAYKVILFYMSVFLTFIPFFMAV